MRFQEDEQEIFGWIGNIIFVGAQFSQVLYTHKKKTTLDISYWMIALMFIGNVMYTTFGYTDGSLSLFVGSAISCVLLIFLGCQKIYYDNYYLMSSYEQILN